MICYFFGDREVALWVQSQNLSRMAIIEWATKIADLIKFLVLCLFFAIFSQDDLKPRTYEQTQLAIIALFIGVAVMLKDGLKIFFGRYWPSTWIDNNPSFIQGNAYGFHFFQRGTWYESFPSGHATITFYVMTVVWILFPKWRFLAILIAVLQFFSLIAMNYHFLGDVFAGAFLGILCALYAIKASSSPFLQGKIKGVKKP